MNKEADSEKSIKKWFIIGAIVLLLMAFIAMGTIIFTEFLELLEIGYTIVAFTNLKVKITTYLASFAIILAVIFINTMIMRKIMLSKGSTLKFLQSKKTISVFSFVVTIVASSFVSNTIYSLYLSFKNSVAFNIADPIFGRDLGYYIFQRPFLVAVCDSAKGVMLFLILYTLAFYVFMYVQKDIESFKNIIYEKSIITHNIINVIIYFIIKVISYRFSSESILYKSFGEFSGAGFTEIFIWLKYYRIAPVVFFVVIVLTLYFIKKGKVKSALISIAVVPAFFLLTFATATVVQLAFVNPYEVSMEQKYIEYNISATKEGFGLTDVVEKEYAIENDLTLRDIAQNKAAIDNIQITDSNATLTSTNNLQTLKGFYNFKDSDITNYEINGRKTAVNIAAREFDKNKLRASAKSYIDRRLRYTHGYGVVMNPINKITEEGQPKYIIKDIPVESYEGAPKVSQPRIYYGELTNDYIIVGSTYPEIDYMEGEQRVEYRYEGAGGIELNLINRAMFSIKHGDVMMVLSGYITPDSKLLTNRNIIDRVRKVAPFLEYDNDPYIIIDQNGRLKWVIDAYTKTNMYPYSQTYEGINYIRNSAKVIIDAYDGTVDFYITDRADPLILSYERMYPGLFKSGLPADIVPHIKYSERLFKLQAEVYKKYHMTEADTIYSKSDMWVGAKEKYNSGEIVDVEPYYNLMKLDENGTEELALMYPYTPQGTGNLVSWLAVGSESGKLVVNRFPKGKAVYGTLHMENKIDNDPNISREISLWNQGGATVIKGNMLVIPVKNSLLYVEPIYTTTKNSSPLPEVKRIVVGYKDSVAMEPTIEKALEVLLGVEKPTFTHTGETIIDIVDKAISEFNDMKNFSKEGDFKSFGQALSALEKTMGELEERKSEISIAEKVDDTETEESILQE